MKTNSKRVLALAPRATEKTYAEQTKRTYVFNVPLDASKQLVKQLPEVFLVVRGSPHYPEVIRRR